MRLWALLLAVAILAALLAGGGEVAAQTMVLCHDLERDLVTRSQYIVVRYWAKEQGLQRCGRVDQVTGAQLVQVVGGRRGRNDGLGGTYIAGPRPEETERKRSAD